jgi:hypothetical protein
LFAAKDEGLLTIKKLIRGELIHEFPEMSLVKIAARGGFEII